MLFSGAVLAAVLAPWTPVQFEGQDISFRVQFEKTAY